MTAEANTSGVQVKVRMASFLVVALAAGAMLVSPNTSAQTPDQDFAARCAAPGVLVCNGLNQASDLVAVPPGTGMEPANDGTIQGAIDTATKVSGGGSLKFILRPGVTFANIGGAFSTSLGRAFGSGSTFYVQWRQMVSPEYLTNNLNFWHSSIKQNIIHGPSNTCQATEFVTLTANNTANTANWPSLFTNCGDGFNTDPVTNQLCNNCPNGGPLIQQGSSNTPSPNGSGYNCNYQNQVAGDGLGSGCFYIQPNVWYTYYQKYTLGQQGQANTSLDSYVAVNGGPYKEFQRASGIPWGIAPDTTYQLFRFETYMTELARGGLPSKVPAFVWYDELIISTQPIAAPGVGPYPAPQNLRVTQ
jgi:hypothetical protein